MATRLSRDERNIVAQRIFAALCAHYPKHYIGLIECKSGASPPVLSASAADVEGPDPGVRVEADASRPTRNLREGPAMDTLASNKLSAPPTGDVCVSQVAWGGTHEKRRD
jgi:hypothetical protein